MNMLAPNATCFPNGICGRICAFWQGHLGDFVVVDVIDIEDLLRGGWQTCLLTNVGGNRMNRIMSFFFSLLVPLMFVFVTIFPYKPL